MNFKPADFFFGLFDLLTIILPGAVLAYFFNYYYFHVLNHPQVEILPADKDELIVVFVFASYLTGHFIFIIGSQLDGFLYPPFRNFFARKNFDITYNAVMLTKEKLVQSESRKTVLMNTLPEKKKKSLSEYFTVKDSNEKIERDLKDSLKGKLFRPKRFWIVLKFEYYRKLKPRLNKILREIFFVRQEIEPDENSMQRFKKAKEIELINTFKWAKLILEIKQPSMLDEIKRFEVTSKFFRSLLVVLMIILVFQFHPYNLMGIIICITLAILSLWRYAEQRYKSTLTAYESILALSNFVPELSDEENKTFDA